MSLEEFTGWKVVCDSCGEPDGFTCEGFGFMVVESEEEGRQMVTDCEGTMDATGRITCLSCIENGEVGADD